MSTSTCGVCSEAPSKYKCPHCEVKYCSITCFKSHIATHDAASPAREDSTPQIVEAESLKNDDENGDKTNPYLALQNHPQFQPLFSKYPQLKSQLRRVLNITLNPYDRPGRHDAEAEGAPKTRYKDRVQGQWTQEKADELATKVLMDLKREDDGVGDFMALVNSVFTRDGDRSGQGEHGVGHGGV